MTAILRRLAVIFGFMTLVTGVAYPLLVTGIARLAFAHQADGSLIVRDGKTVGSELLGQAFSAPGHFWGRLSGTTPQAYNGASSSGTNLSPTNPGVVAAARARIKALHDADPGNSAPVPVDLVTASGSGLDPDISAAAAIYQIGRVARARRVPEDTIRRLVAAHTQGRTLGLLGEPRVNVLQLNLALDALR
jgi:K+-transporting ATPase ATPase C chain